MIRLGEFVLIYSFYPATSALGKGEFPRSRGSAINLIGVNRRLSTLTMAHGIRLRRCLPLVIVFLIILYVMYVNIDPKRDSVDERDSDKKQTPGERPHADEQQTTTDLAAKNSVKNKAKPSYLTLQRARNATIHEICGPKRSIRTLTTAQSMYLFKHMIVDDNHRLIYCYVPKAACANWKRVMQVLSGRYASVDDIHKVDHTDFKFLSAYSPEEIHYRLENYFKFIFVRHPLDRLFSAWHNKFHENFLDMQKRYGVPIVKKFRENPPDNPEGDDVTLEEFFKYLAGTSTTQYNEHWMPFDELCQPCYVDYNFIGMYEDLENEATTMIKHLGLSKKVTYPTRQPYYNKNAVPDDAKIVEWRKMSLETFQQALKKYAKDFGLFGYAMPENVEEYLEHWIK